jgi:hypothetical protein
MLACALLVQRRREHALIGLPQVSAGRRRPRPGCALAGCVARWVERAMVRALVLALLRRVLEAKVPVWALACVLLAACWPLWHQAADAEHPPSPARSLAAWGASTVERCTSYPTLSPGWLLCVVTLAKLAH